MAYGLPENSFDNIELVTHSLGFSFTDTNAKPPNSSEILKSPIIKFSKSEAHPGFTSSSTNSCVLSLYTNEPTYKSLATGSLLCTISAMYLFSVFFVGIFFTPLLFVIWMFKPRL